MTKNGWESEACWTCQVDIPWTFPRRGTSGGPAGYPIGTLGTTCHVGDPLFMSPLANQDGVAIYCQKCATRWPLSDQASASGYFYTRADEVAPHAIDKDERNNSVAIYAGPAGQTGEAHCFTIKRTIIATAIALVISKLGSPGTIMGYVYATTGTPGVDAEPTGAALASTGVIPASSIVAGALTWTRFALSSPLTMSPGNYAVAMEHPDGDVSNRIDVGLNTAFVGAGNRASGPPAWSPIAGQSIPYSLLMAGAQGQYDSPVEVYNAGETLEECPACVDLDLAQDKFSEHGTTHKDLFWSGDDRSVGANVDKGARFDPPGADLINKPY